MTGPAEPFVSLKPTHYVSSSGLLVGIIYDHSSDLNTTKAAGAARSRASSSSSSSSGGNNEKNNSSSTSSSSSEDEQDHQQRRQLKQHYEQLVQHDGEEGEHEEPAEENDSPHTGLFASDFNDSLLAEQKTVLWDRLPRHDLAGVDFPNKVSFIKCPF